ncbi:MAG: GNAT family N-acetyltransferase, partial [Rickettsiales bacterium]
TIMREEDIKKVVELAIDLWRHSYYNILDRTYLDNLSDQKFIKSREIIIKDDNFRCLVVKNYEEKIIGFADSGKSWTSKIEDKQGEIYAMYVEIMHQHCGIGKTLFMNHKRWLKCMGYETLNIWTLKENINARKFYSKMGGIKQSDRHKDIGGIFYPEVQYIWQL